MELKLNLYWKKKLNEKLRNKSFGPFFYKGKKVIRCFSIKITLLFAGGYFEEACKGGRTCRVGLCRCTDGKTGDTCEIIGMYLRSDRSSIAY